METATALDPETQSGPQQAEEPEGRYEVVDGQIVEKPAMGIYENQLAKILTVLLDNFGLSNRLGQAFMETLYLLDPETKLRRCPDVSFVSADRWPLERRLSEGKSAWEMVPDLAIEIISPTNRTGDDVRKVAQYFQAGVKQVWVVYPSVKQVYVYQSLTEIRVLTRADTLEGGTVVPGFQLSVNDLFGEG